LLKGTVTSGAGLSTERVARYVVRVVVQPTYGLVGLPDSRLPVSTASNAAWSRRCMIKKSHPSFISFSTSAGLFAG
jgi:hypothetical protein